MNPDPRAKFLTCVKVRLQMIFAAPAGCKTKVRLNYATTDLYCSHKKRQVRGKGSEYYNSGMSRQKKNYSAEFKAQVVLELLGGDKPLNELAKGYQIAPATLSAWHRVFQERAQTVFQQGPTAQDKEITRQNAEIEALQKKVGQLTIECDPLRGQAGSKKI